MKKFNYSIDDDISFQEKYQITPNELFILKILLLLQEDEQDLEYFQRFIQVPYNKESFRNNLQSLQNKGFQTFTKNMSQSQADFWDSVFSSPSWGKIKELFYEDSDRAVATAERVERFTENPYSLEDIFSAWSDIAKEDKPNFRKSVDIVLSQWNKLEENERNDTNFREFVTNIMQGL